MAVISLIFLAALCKHSFQEFVAFAFALMLRNPKTGLAILTNLYYIMLKTLLIHGSHW